MLSPSTTPQIKKFDLSLAEQITKHTQENLRSPTHAPSSGGMGIQFDFIRGLLILSVILGLEHSLNCSHCIIMEKSDCYLRQGAGGMEFAHFGSRTCSLRRFYNPSQAYFGHKSEEHIKTIKKHCLGVKNGDC